jgi:hypothetical protein
MREKAILVRENKNEDDSAVFTRWVKAQDRGVRAEGAAERASCISSLQSSRASVTHCWVRALNFW